MRCSPVSSQAMAGERRPSRRYWRLLSGAGTRKPWASGVILSGAFIEPASAHLLDGETLADIGPFAAGLSHPVLGPDHFLAMFSVGLVSAVMGGRHLWRVPLAFVTIMPIGWLIGWAALPFPPVEIGIALSVIALGGASLLAERLQPWMIYAGVVGFAALHGYAHGSETPAGTSEALYILGFMLATAGIHVLGLFVGDLLHRHGEAVWPIRSLSALIMAAGAGYLAMALRTAAMVT